MEEKATKPQKNLFIAQTFICKPRRWLGINSDISGSAMHTYTRIFADVIFHIFAH